MSIKSQAIILRRGQATQVNIRNSAERVDTRDRVENVSVQLLNSNTAKMTPATYALLMGPLPPGQYALCRAHQIIAEGGTIVEDPLPAIGGNPANPYHAHVSGITVDDLWEILRKNQR
jgi:hypothetical protein